MMGLKIYSILTVHGTKAWDENVTRLFDLSRQMYDLIEQQPNVQAIAKPQSNIICYRYFDSQLPGTTLNKINNDIRDSFLRTGKFYIVKTMIDDTVWLRSTIGSATTTVDDLQELLDTIVQLGQQQSN